MPYGTSPIQPVTFGTAMQISLNNYYDLLKAQAATLQADEFLQLKLVADGVDLSMEEGEKSYEWFSKYNLLNRCDLEIEPNPLSGTVTTGIATLADTYGRFLRVLRSFVTIQELSPADQILVAGFDVDIDAKQEDVIKLAEIDTIRWNSYCKAKGIEVTDQNAYTQWSGTFGKIRDIQRLMNEISVLTYKRKTILNKQYPKPDDKAIVDAEFDYDNPLMRLRFPRYEDYKYGTKFSPAYLSMLPLGSSALFDDRYAYTWDKTLKYVVEKNIGVLAATFSRTTSSSNSITTDWGSSISVGYGFIHAKASVSEHKQISEDFSSATAINLAASASIRLGINPGPWFKPSLFTHAHVLANPELFTEFFGKNGSLLYYPTALILVRGFSVEFIHSSAWTYDYKKNFSASGGGGFNVFGINFGGASNYSSNISEHQIDQTNTTLKFSDAADTIRFAGYAVKKNDVLAEAFANAIKLFHEAP